MSPAIPAWTTFPTTRSDGRRIIPGETFHTDHSNHPRPPSHHAVRSRAAALQRRRHPIRQHARRLDDLPEGTKQRIDGLKAVHVYLSKYSPRPLGRITEESRRNLPPPGIHLLVRTHPENGRKALFLNPVRMESIVGMEDKEALALIDDLMRTPRRKNTRTVTSGAMATGCCGTTAASCIRRTPT